jgi:hypothetical protein
LIGVATLDPSTLALWYNSSALASPDNIHVMEQSFRLAVGSDLDKYRKFYSTLGENNKAFSADIASAIWHEKRHFLDLILTNYGAYRVRQFFMISANAFPVLKALPSRVAFPFLVYADPIRRRLAAVEAPTGILKTFVDEVVARQMIMSLENRVLDIAGHKCEMGGDAQLEALAYNFQIGANQTWLGYDGAREWQARLGELHGNTRYRWLEIISDSYQLAPNKKVGQQTVAADHTLVIAIVYASLMMRSWGQSYSHDRLGEVGILPPYARFRALLEDLRGYSYSFGSLSVEAAWTLANERCRKLFGRTAEEELDIDYDFEGSWVAKLPASDPAAKAFSDFHKLRGRFIQTLKKNPCKILDLRDWSKDLLPDINPYVVLAYPPGFDATLPADLVSVLEERLTQHERVCWAALFQPRIGGFSFEDQESWLFVFKYLAPLAKLILFGRRHDLMIGSELLLMEEQLRNVGKSVVFDDAFEYPVEGDDTSDFWRLLDREESKCDFCASPIARPSGRVIGPWGLRRNNKLLTVCVHALGDGDLESPIGDQETPRL